jgi:hypothetical protein
LSRRLPRHQSTFIRASEHQPPKPKRRTRADKLRDQETKSCARAAKLRDQETPTPPSFA